MEWTLPETITVGFVIAFSLGIIYRFLGQRTDPKLLELFELQIKSDTKTQERLSNALDRNTETVGAVQAGIERSFNSFVKTMEQMLTTGTAEHQTHLAAIDSIPNSIIPAINTLAQKFTEQKGSVDLMNGTIETQNDSIQQILDSLLRLETQVNLICDKFGVLGVEIEDTKKELSSIKGDVENLKGAGQQPTQEAPTVAPAKTPKPDSKGGTSEPA